MRKKIKKLKSIQGKGAPARSQAKAAGREPPGQESPVPEKQELHQSSRMERVSQGTQAGPQEGRGCPQTSRGTNRGPAPQGRVRHTLQLSSLKGWSGHTVGPRSSCSGGSGGGSTPRGLRGPRSAIAAAQEPEPSARGDTAQDPVLPLGQTKVGRHRTVRKLLPLESPELSRSATPLPNHRGHCRLGAAVLTA